MSSLDLDLFDGLVLLDINTWSLKGALVQYNNTFVCGNHASLMSRTSLMIRSPGLRKEIEIEQLSHTILQAKCDCEMTFESGSSQRTSW